MIRFYLAARYSRREELNVYRDQLAQCGYLVTSRWLDGGHEIEKDTQGLSAQAADAERERFAVEDWDDLIASNVVVNFTEAPRSTNGRGGRHVELGGAMAAGKICVVIGPRENVFHHHPRVIHFDSWSEFVDRWLSKRISE